MNHQAILEEIRHEVLPLLGEGKGIVTLIGFAAKSR